MATSYQGQFRDLYLKCKYNSWQKCPRPCVLREGRGTKLNQGLRARTCFIQRKSFACFTKSLAGQGFQPLLSHL